MLNKWVAVSGEEAIPGGAGGFAAAAGGAADAQAPDQARHPMHLHPPQLPLLPHLGTIPLDQLSSAQVAGSVVL